MENEDKMIFSVVSALSHVNEHIYVIIVPLHVLVFYQPLNLLLDQLLAGKEHVLQDINQLHLKRVTRSANTHQATVRSYL